MTPTSLSEYELMKIHVATMFECDANRRLRCVREPWGTQHAPPRFYIGRTVRGNVWRFSHNLPEQLVQKLEILCRSEPITGDLRRPARVTKAVRSVLQVHRPIEKEERGPAYLIPVAGQSQSDTVLITKQNVDFLKDGFPWIIPYISSNANIGPISAVISDGSAVSICFCARLTLSAAEAGVETLEAVRGQGHAPKAVALWAAAACQRGLLPLYSTTWQNESSLRVTQKLKMVCYGEDWLIE